jgi:hypothetical protein
MLSVSLSIFQKINWTIIKKIFYFRSQCLFLKTKGKRNLSKDSKHFWRIQRLKLPEKNAGMRGGKHDEAMAKWCERQGVGII